MSVRLRVKWVGILLAGLAVAWPAFAVVDPFPDQPGALSAAEIQAAGAAMQSVVGREAPLPLAASGKRAAGHVMPLYVLYAGPLADLSGGVSARRQIVCNYFQTLSRWQCTQPHDEIRMTVRGMEHVFAHQVSQGSGDWRAVADAVEFVYSQCFHQQFAAIGGPKPTEGPIGLGCHEDLAVLSQRQAPSRRGLVSPPSLPP